MNAIQTGVFVSSLFNENHNQQLDEQQSTSSSSAATTTRCCKVCNCSNRIFTCIIITIIPIAITSTLICVFMMQKTNLYEYAIYTFVIFCVAFVFPFALFFITVIFNKAYKCYKRMRNQNFNTSFMNYQFHQHQHQHEHHINNESNELANRLCQSPSPFRSNPNNASSDYFGQRIVPVQNCYYTIQCFDDGRLTFTNDNTFAVHDNTFAVHDNTFAVHDHPPTYEMALMCPRVPYSNSDTQDDGSVIPITQQITLPSIQIPSLTSEIPSLSPPPYDEKMNKPLD